MSSTDRGGFIGLEGAEECRGTSLTGFIEAGLLLKLAGHQGVPALGREMAGYAETGKFCSRRRRRDRHPAAESQGKQLNNS